MAATLVLIELDRRADGVRGAAAECALVVDGRAPAPEVGARRQRGEKLRRRGVQVVALVGLVRDPAVAADLSRLGHDLSSQTARLPARNYRRSSKRTMTQPPDLTMVS